MRHLVTALATAALVVPLAAARPAQNAVIPDHAPLAPAALGVDDRSDPLGVQGIPQFGWLPRDPDGNEVQSAYQLVVTATDGSVVWDSGRVASPAQSWVPYAGPALAPGTAYRWAVRTWDRAGRRSPFARARFGTGLGDQDWSGAEWIRRPATGSDASNDYTLARKTLQVGDGSPVVRADAYVAAMGDWALHVNGRTVDRTSSYGYPGEGYYDVSDITALAKAGQPLTVGVLYHYWTCTCQGRANGPVSPEGPSGLLVKVTVDHADGTRDLLISDGTWRVTQDAAESVATLTYRNSDAGDRVEYIDATKQLTGWDLPGYDDSAWQAATVIGPHPRPSPVDCTAFEGHSPPCAFTHLVAQQAHITTRTVHPVSVLRLPDGTVFADMGKVYAAVPSVTIPSGTAGRALTITTSFRENNTTTTAAVPAGATTVPLESVTGLHAGDQITVDAPADGYGAGDPETRTVAAVGSDGATLSQPLSQPHASGAWVENSRAGTSKLDTQGSNMRFFYTESGGAQVAAPFTYWGWRYIEISDPGEPLTAADIAAVVQNTDAPARHAATFHSDNATLDAVFALMRRSALQSGQNTFLDTPTREKGQFLGDTVDESFASMESLDERSLTREAIADFADSQARYWPNGALNAVYPNGDAKRDIPDYSEMFPEWVMRYYQLTGDASLVGQVYPVMKRVAGYIDAAIIAPQGLVYELPGGTGPYQFGIIDWPPPMRYDTVRDGNGAETVVNALAVGANRAVAQAAAVLAQPADAAAYGSRADALAAAMNAELRNPGTGRYADGLAADTLTRIESYSEHAQTYAIDYGIAPRSAYPALGDYITAEGMKQGPMDLRQLEAALVATGRIGTLVSLLTDPGADGPAKILAEGGTFMWEQWDPGCSVAACSGSQVDQGSNESFSHGWGSAGIDGILEGVLGVDVTAPGAAAVTITVPGQGPRHASGSEWTERGPVSVDWTRTATGYTVHVGVPDNVAATVVLPGAGYRAGGDGAPRLTSTGGGRSTFTVGSGHTVFASA